MKRRKANTSSEETLSTRIMGDGEEVIRANLRKVSKKIVELENSSYNFGYLNKIQSDIFQKEEFLENAKEHLASNIYDEAKSLLDDRSTYIEEFRRKAQQVKSDIEKCMEIRSKLQDTLLNIEKSKRMEKLLLENKEFYRDSPLFNMKTMPEDMDAFEHAIMEEVKAIERKSKLLDYAVEAYTGISQESNTGKESNERIIENQNG